MPFTQEPAGDRRLLDYVLGRLPDADAEALDEASIVDDAVAARLRAVEDDLIDAYVRGALDAETLQRFEHYYLASPRRREKVTFARNFTRAVDRAAVQTPPASVAQPRRAIWKLTAVAAALFVACAGLVMQTVRLGRGISVAEQARQALDRRAQDLQKEVTDLRAATDTAARQPSAPKTALSAPAIALVLTPQMRDAGPVPAVVLPASAQRIAFELRLDSAEPAAYQVALRDPADNRIVWRSGWMASAGPSLMVSLPAGIFKPQHYSLDLLMRDAHGIAADVAGSYAFEIASR
ncbi:MAG TPA: hypothetical protein VFA27_16185 [Vicinamibacterales bacterium]|nr:hypothetical protein [Vicinamibacterales bacterium]